jgi:acyl-coenzyme A thioesterase PaaI-like protein
MNSQFNSTSCFACGLENPAGLQLRFTDNGLDQVFTQFIITPAHAGYPGMAHGGIVAAILDEVGGRTVMIGHPNRFFVTARLDVRYRLPVPVGVPLRATGWLLVRRARRTRAYAEIFKEDGCALAEADLLYTDFPAGLQNSAVLESEFGWKQYMEPRGPGAGKEQGMPQIAKGGKWVFGWCMVGQGFEIQIPPAAYTEYGFQPGECAILLRGSQRSGGFSIGRPMRLANSPLQSRFFSQVMIGEAGRVVLPPDAGAQPGERLLVVRGSGLALGFLQRGPIYEEALKHPEIELLGSTEVLTSLEIQSR